MKITRCQECGEPVHYIFDWCDHAQMYLCDVCVDEVYPVHLDTQD